MRSCLGKRVSSLPHVTCKVSALSQPSVARNAMLQGAIRVPCCSDTEEHTFLDITDRWGRMGPRAARIAPLKRHPISIDFMIDKNAKKWVWLQPGAFFASTSTHDFEPTWRQNGRPKIAFWTKSIGNLYDFWKTACVETERSIPRPPRGPKVAKWAILAPNAEIQKPLKNQWNFAFFGF